MKKIGLLCVMLTGLWQEGVVYAADNQPVPAVVAPQTKEVDKDILIIYLRLLNQKSGVTAQLESSMTPEQKQMINVITSTSKDLQGQIAKLNENCGKGFVFAEETANCKAISAPAMVPVAPVAK